MRFIVDDWRVVYYSTETQYVLIHMDTYCTDDNNFIDRGQYCVNLFYSFVFENVHIINKHIVRTVKVTALSSILQQQYTVISVL